MPNADQILSGLRAVANEWPVLAALWHLFFGALGVALAAGWRPERRDLGLYLVLPLISVSALGWMYWNPFNGTLVAAVGLVLLVTSVLLGRERVSPGPVWMIVPGVLLFLFGWGYPHFLDTAAWWPYAWRAPTGLVPCPTLAIITGLTMVFGGFGSRFWAWVLGVTGLFYGLAGAFYLGVTIDWALAAGSLLLIVSVQALNRTAKGRRQAARPSPDPG